MLRNGPKLVSTFQKGSENNVEKGTIYLVVFIDGLYWYHPVLYWLFLDGITIWILVSISLNGLIMKNGYYFWAISYTETNGLSYLGLSQEELTIISRIIGTVTWKRNSETSKLDSRILKLTSKTNPISKWLMSSNSWFKISLKEVWCKTKSTSLSPEEENLRNLTSKTKKLSKVIMTLAVKVNMLANQLGSKSRGISSFKLQYIVNIIKCILL